MADALNFFPLRLSPTLNCFFSLFFLPGGFFKNFGGQFRAVLGFWFFSNGGFALKGGRKLFFFIVGNFYFAFGEKTLPFPDFFFFSSQKTGEKFFGLGSSFSCGKGFLFAYKNQETGGSVFLKKGGRT